MMNSNSLTVTNHNSLIISNTNLIIKEILSHNIMMSEGVDFIILFYKKPFPNP